VSLSIYRRGLIIIIAFFIYPKTEHKENIKYYLKIQQVKNWMGTLARTQLLRLSSFLQSGQINLTDSPSAI